MTQLSIGLLGGFRARLGSGQPLTIRRKKAQALLAYLALRPALAHSRESLAGLLWSGTTDEHARHNLRQTLFALRRAVEIGPTPFRLEGETVALPSEAIAVDVAAFERCVQQGTRDTLHEAVTLYRGELLEGFSLDEAPFDDWVAAERQRLRELALGGLDRLLALNVAAGAVEQSVATGVRLLALDPLRESAHRALMELYARQGRRTAALRQYQVCVEALRRELGVGPEPATTQCYQQTVRRAAPRETGSDRADDAGVAPTTRYTRSGEVNLAYQIIGSGPADLVLVPGWLSNVECFWEEPRLARFLRRLASFGRLILFDKRGTGLSDRVTLDALPSLEQRMSDVRAVMDTVGCERATLVGYSEGGTMCALFAATYPERTAGLVMIGAYARWMWSADHPWGCRAEDYPRIVERIRREWGGPIGIDRRAPSLAHDATFGAWWARFLRMSASPTAALAFTEMNRDIDVRHVLATIGAPTLVLHAVGDQVIEAACGRYMAARIPNARFVELPSDDHLPWLSDGDIILDEIERFVATFELISEPDRLLVTVVVADLVPSARNGGGVDVERTRDRYHEAARLEIIRFRGRFLDAAGPTVLAAFDGPARAIRCASAIVDSARRLGIAAKAGLHTGECEIRADGLTGAALEVARRVAAVAKDGEVVVSTTVKDLVAGSGLEFLARGEKADGDGTRGQPLFTVVSRVRASVLS